MTDTVGKARRVRQSTESLLIPTHVAPYIHTHIPPPLQMTATAFLSATFDIPSNLCITRIHPIPLYLSTMYVH
jgi:hypothetical protein